MKERKTGLPLKALRVEETLSCQRGHCACPHQSSFELCPEDQQELELAEDVGGSLDV